MWLHNTITASLYTERKNKKHAKLYFACQGKGEHCLYNKHFFTMKTRNPRIWIHLMFLALQVQKTLIEFVGFIICQMCDYSKVLLFLIVLDMY